MHQPRKDPDNADVLSSSSDLARDATYDVASSDVWSESDLLAHSQKCAFRLVTIPGVSRMERANR
ncbi:MAG: hypothetical protein BGO98_49240 [Myxococcales bacterium 68-20]|nr:MAG: hypothetical protein BGO98_49240 [Myxococcales bacterium 68-20]